MVEAGSTGQAFDSHPLGASKGTPGDAKCVTEILKGEQNNDVWGGGNFTW